jgi:nucleoside-diphosphate-sugar epimerase
LIVLPMKAARTRRLPRQLEGSGMRVLVTGANGHVGNNLCRALVARGYRVRASLRSLADPAKSAPLHDLPDVDIVELDVRDAERFDAAVRDVEVLFHVAATYALYTGSREKDAEMLCDSLEGVENALRSAARRHVRKVVLTSSIASLPMRAPGEAAATEQDWRTDLRLPYYRAKTLAEQRAWALAAELGVELVSVLPGTIGGPGFYRRTPSTDLIECILTGALRLGAPRGNLPYVDIRDVVEGHVLAAERAVTGRFILCNDRAPTLQELTQILHGIDPSIACAPRLIPDALLGALPLLDALNAKLSGSPRLMTAELIASSRGQLWQLSNARARAELGWVPRVPLETSLRDTLTTLSELRAAEGKTARSAPAHRLAAARGRDRSRPHTRALPTRVAR